MGLFLFVYLILVFFCADDWIAHDLIFHKLAYSMSGSLLWFSCLPSLSCPSPRTSHSYCPCGLGLTKHLLSSYRSRPSSERSQLNSTRAAGNYSNSVLLPTAADQSPQRRQRSAKVRMDRWKLLQTFKLISHNSYTNKTGSSGAVFILL